MQDDRKAHQITLQELGIIPKEPKRKEEVRKQYAFPCGGCACSHCANNVETPDTCTGEMKEPCRTCPDLIADSKQAAAVAADYIDNPVMEFGA